LPPSERNQSDFVLLYNVIDHIDEEACAKIGHDPAAEKRYVDIFRQLSGFLKDKGRLIVSDAAKNNFFGDLGLVSPFARNIYWPRHQNSGTWKKLIHRAGLTPVRTEWTRPYPFRHFGNLATNHLTAYLILSHFVIESIKSSD